MCAMWIICSYANSIIVEKHDKFSVIIQSLDIISGYYAYHKLEIFEISQNITQHALLFSKTLAISAALFFSI